MKRRGAKPARRGRKSSDLARRLALREAFFRRSIDPAQLLQPFEHRPGLLYFVKDSRSRLMAISRKSTPRMGFRTDREIIGLTARDYLPADLAEKYLAGDQWVVRTGKPLRNVVEMW